MGRILKISNDQGYHNSEVVIVNAAKFYLMKSMLATIKHNLLDIERIENS